MKTWIPILCAVAAFLAGCAKKKDAGDKVLYEKLDEPVVVDLDRLEERDGSWYFGANSFTFWGIGVSSHDNGKKKEEVTFKDGKKHGLGTGWYENGQKSYELNYNDGKEDGLLTEWFEDGQKRWKSTYKDGKRDGLSIWWHKNGHKEEEAIYKDGILMSATVWKPSGEKCPDTNLVDGTGIVCRYWGIGQKRYESTFKYGKLISERRWDEDGNPKWPPTLTIF